MGKASRKKKLRKIEAEKADTKPHKPMSGKTAVLKKIAASKEAMVKKVADSKAAVAKKVADKKAKNKQAPSKTAKHTGAEKHASETKSAKSVKKPHAKPTVLDIPAESPTAVGAVKGYLKEIKDDYLKSLDNEKLEIFKKEAAIILKGGAYFTVSILFFVALLITVELHSDNRVLAKTRAGELELGYMKYDRAREELQKEIKTYFQSPLTFSLEGEKISVSPEELGISPSMDRTMELLPVIKFQKTNPAELMTSLFFETSIEPVYAMDGDKIIKTLENKFALENMKARNARLVFKDDALQVEPEKSGVAINSEKLIGELQANIENLDNRAIILELVHEDPRISAEELSVEKDRLVGLLEKPVTLTYEKEKLTLKLIDHLDAVNFTAGAQAQMPEDAVNTGSKIRIAVDLDIIDVFLQENLISKIDIPTSPANIYTNEEGRVIIDGKGEDGRAVAKNDLIAAIETAVNEAIAEVTIPVNIEHAPLTISDDLKELGIKELIATGHSAYYGSPANRMFNIDYGTAKYNGLIIKPGEEFSFNDVLGPVDAASGFKPEKVIKKDKLEMEYGGGICQVSTTFYRAALLAGLPITERRPHSWKVSYYSQSMGDGLDATIYPGVSDLKFINDTPASLLVQAYTEGAEAYFKIYGTNDGRTITMDGPHGGGLTYRWNRTVSINGEDTTEEIWSRYRPIPPPTPSTPAKPVAAAATVESSGQVNFSF